MSTTTTNYGLKKPARSEYFNVEDQNGNMDLIDVQLKTLNDNKESLLKNVTSKASLADEDTIPLTDSAASSITKKITFSNMKAVLKTYFDTLYNKYTHPTYTSRTEGLYKVTVDGTGHVNAATGVAKSDITALGIPAQDTVTEVVDNLTSTDAAKALSAKQGKVLNDLISTKLPLAGGTLSGDLNISKSNPFLKLINVTRSNRQFQIYQDVFDTTSFLNTDAAGQNGSGLLVLSEASALTDRVAFVKYASGVLATYKLFGEHNITISTAAPGSTLAEGAQHQVY